MLWFPVGYTAGYLVLLRPRRRAAAPLGCLHAAGLRRDPARLARRAPAARACSWSAIGWLYLLPQFAGRRADPAARSPARRAGSADCVVAVVVVLNVVAGRHALDHLRAGLPVLAEAHRDRACPVLFLVLAWQGDGGPTPADGPADVRAAPPRCASDRRDRRRCGRRCRCTLTVHARPPGDRSRAARRTPVAHDAGTGDLAGHRAGALTFAAGSPVPHATGREPSDGAGLARDRAPGRAAASTRCTRRTR